MRKLGIIILSLIVATICYQLADFITRNLVIGMIVRYEHNVADLQVLAAYIAMSGFFHLALWVFMLWGIRKLVLRKKIQL